LSEIDVKELEKSVFNTLYAIDTRDRSVQKDTGKTKLNYLPWATVYSEASKHFNQVDYEFLRQTVEVEETELVTVDEKTTITKVKKYKREYPFFDTEKGLEVRTRVTIDGVTKEMSLPVYDTSYKCMGNEPYTYSTKYGDKTVPAAKFDDIYKSILRCFAKNLSMFGVGINLWTKEETSEIVLNMEKLQRECLELINKKSALSEDAKKKVASICKEADENANGDPRLIEDDEVLKDLKKKLLSIRK
jgi:hypothetical protein